MRAVLTCALIVWTSSTAVAQDLSKHFDGITGTFVLLNARTGAYLRHDSARAAQRFAPCSTFKIPHTAILLETGIAPDPEFAVKYDPALKQQGAWAQDHTLRSAYRVSALWYYHVLAKRVGTSTEERFLKKLRYGNQSASGGLDGSAGPFWVDGTLRISADEQVEFLRRFHENQLGLSRRTTTLTKDIMLADSTPRWRLSAKTGACRPAGEDATMWYVGYVERDSNVYYFALQLGAKEFGTLFEQRVTKAKAILTHLGVLD
ncbi:MAG: class D beta-lactamase [Acidobacteria bacterium]|nr:MAG: class D beta-lactamase [Acidobacteriota bacterium]